MKAKADFLMYNKDVLSQWQPLATKYSIKDRDLSMSNIAACHLEPVKARDNSVIWAYHISTLQYPINPQQEQYSGCFQLQKMKAKQQTISELDEITNSFAFPDFQTELPTNTTHNQTYCQIFDFEGKEMQIQQLSFDFLEQSENTPQQLFYNIQIPKSFLKILIRDDFLKSPDKTMTPQKAQQTPVQLQYQSARRKCPFSSYRILNVFKTPNPQYSTFQKHGIIGESSFNTADWTSPLYDHYPQNIPNELPKPPKNPSKK